MEEQLYLTNLYDYYKELLTEKQRDYFEEYYFNNLSLSEISENFCVSRNAVHKQLKEIENKLIEYEEKLKLYSKSIEIKRILINIDEETKNKIENLI
ncbi:MAG: hypothetical protein HFI86_00070 [Bacilli bacterium]|nr:hypothetical protein [Bacilli bacterium]MCI9433657.1 hypothetical protein [Bacilli bacterium]